MEMSGQFHTSCFTPLLIAPQNYPLHRMLARLQSWSGCGGKEKNLPCHNLNSHLAHSQLLHCSIPAPCVIHNQELCLLYVKLPQIHLR